MFTLDLRTRDAAAIPSCTPPREAFQRVQLHTIAAQDNLAHGSKSAAQPTGTELVHVVYQLRYRTYVLELGLTSKYADDVRATITDPMDATATHVIATIGHEVVGCARINLSRHGNIGSFDQLLGMQGRQEHPERTAVITKFITRNDMRGAGIDRLIVDQIATTVCGHGVTSVFIDCRLALVNYYRRLGFVRSGDDFDHYETGRVTPMMVDLLDHDHLSRAHSPLFANAAVRALRPEGPAR